MMVYEFLIFLIQVTLFKLGNMTLTPQITIFPTRGLGAFILICHLGISLFFHWLRKDSGEEENLEAMDPGPVHGESVQLRRGSVRNNRVAEQPRIRVMARK